ncbi:MAG: hypothetical protein AAFY34_16475, partial [Pseudomonadota bacterium]
MPKIHSIDAPSVSDIGASAHIRAGRLAWTHLTDARHPEWRPAAASTVSYGQANVADQYTSVTGRGPLTYDGRGNLTGHNDRSYAF